MATKKRCTKGVVKSGPRKGKCRKVCPKNCKTRTAGTKCKAPNRRATKRKTGKRANCEKFGYSVLLGRCRKSPARRGRARSSDAYDFPAAAWSSSPQRVPVRNMPGSGMVLYRR